MTEVDVMAQRYIRDMTRNTGRLRWRGILRSMRCVDDVINYGTEREYGLLLRCVVLKRARNDRTVWRRGFSTGVSEELP